MSEDIGLALGYTSASFSILLVLSTLIRRNKSSESFAIWHFISWIYLFKWLCAINVTTSSDFVLMYKGLNKAFRPDSIVTITNPCLIPVMFRALGFNYPYFLNNAAFTLCLWGSSLVIYTIFLICKISSFANIRKVVCENFIIRSTLIFYSDLSVFSFLQIREFEISTWYGLTNSVLAVTCLSIQVIFFTLVTFNIHYRLNQGEEVISRMITVIEEFKRDSYKDLLYYSIFMVERIVIAATLTFFDNYGGIQILIIEGFLAAKLLYIIFLRPFKNQFDNFFAGALDFLNIASVGSIIACYGDIGSLGTTIVTWVNFSLVIVAIVLCFFTYTKKIRATTTTEVKETNQTRVEATMDIDKIFTNNKRNSVVNPNKRRSTVHNIGAEIATDYEGKKKVPEEIQNSDPRYSPDLAQNIDSYYNSQNHYYDNQFESLNERIPYYKNLFNKHMDKYGLKNTK